MIFSRSPPGGGGGGIGANRAELDRPDEVEVDAALAPPNGVVVVVPVVNGNVDDEEEAPLIAEGKWWMAFCGGEGDGKWDAEACAGNEEGEGGGGQVSART